MAEGEERTGGRGRIRGWLSDYRFEDTQLGIWLDAIARRPNTLGTLVVGVAGTAIYLFTSSRKPQNLDYFVRLADAFLHGRVFLTEAPSWLNELIPRNGVWYVPYPPVPAVLLMPFVAIFGTNFHQQVASSIFGGVGVAFAWAALGRFELTLRARLGLTAVFGFGTTLWYTAAEGSAWYIGHSAAVMFSMAALALVLWRRWPFLVGFLIGAATFARLPAGLTAPFFLAMAAGIGWPPRLPERSQWVTTLRTVVAFGLGLAIPVGLYVLYNLARWGTVTDGSYVLIPGVLDDPVYAKHGILALEYIPRNLYAIFLRSWNYVDDPPFLQPSWMGLSLFLTTPLFAWLFRARLRDPRVAWAVVATALAAIPIITHGNVGFTQFGYRFSLDFQPMLFVILATVWERGVSRVAWAAAIASIVICAYAFWAIRIGFVAF
jgi:hypothetical protein